MNTEDFKHNDWEKNWSGKWSILFTSHVSEYYCRIPFTDRIDQFLTQNIIISCKGISSAYYRLADKKVFAEKISELIKLEDSRALKICENFKQSTDLFLNFVNQNITKDINLAKYQEFWNILLEKYYPNHLQVKLVVDFLRKDLLEKYLPILEEARVYAEPVFTKAEEFLCELAKIHSHKIGIKDYFITASTKKEFESYLRVGNSLPTIDILADRYNFSILLSDSTKQDILFGRPAKISEDILFPKNSIQELKGQVAFSGKVTGRAKIIINPQEPNDFKNGDVLITGMTRPEFLYLIKKASAIVTDGGGILCHAAIVARELKKPCIIGTEKATQVFKDGDMVEVDAISGKVIKLTKV